MGFRFRCHTRTWAPASFAVFIGPMDGSPVLVFGSLLVRMFCIYHSRTWTPASWAPVARLICGPAVILIAVSSRRIYTIQCIALSRYVPRVRTSRSVIFLFVVMMTCLVPLWRPRPRSIPSVTMTAASPRVRIPFAVFLPVRPSVFVSF